MRGGFLFSDIESFLLIFTHSKEYPKGRSNTSIMLWKKIGGWVFPYFLWFRAEESLVGTSCQSSGGLGQWWTQNGGFLGAADDMIATHTPGAMEKNLVTLPETNILVSWTRNYVGKKSNQSFIGDRAAIFLPESFRIPIDVGRAYRGWFAEHFERWFVGSLDNPLLGCTVWCVSKKEWSLI